MTDQTTFDPTTVFGDLLAEDALDTWPAQDRRGLIGPRTPTGRLPLPSPDTVVRQFVDQGHFVFDADLDLTNERISRDTAFKDDGAEERLPVCVEIADTTTGGPESLTALKSTPDDAAPAGHWFRPVPSVGPGLWSGSLILRMDGPGTEIMGYASISVDMTRCDDLPLEIGDRIGLADGAFDEEVYTALIASYASRNLHAHVSFDHLYIDARHRGSGAARILSQVAGAVYQEIFASLRRWVASGDRDIWMDITFESQILDRRAGLCILPVFSKLEDFLVEDDTFVPGEKRLYVTVDDESELEF